MANNKKFDEIYKSLVNEIDDEIKLEKHIEEKAKEIASQIYISKSARVEINDAVYTIRFHEGRKKHKKIGKTVQVISLVAGNELKIKLAAGNYTPYVAQAEIHNDLSIRENIEMLVESLIRTITGKFKATQDELG